MKGAWQQGQEMNGKTLIRVVRTNGVGGRRTAEEPALPWEVACRG